MFLRVNNMRYFQFFYVDTSAMNLTLGSDFTTFCFVFILLGSRNIALLISVLTYFLFSSELISFHQSVCSLLFLVLLMPSFNLCWSDRIYCVILIIFYLLKLFSVQTGGHFWRKFLELLMFIILYSSKMFCKYFACIII